MNRKAFLRGLGLASVGSVFLPAISNGKSAHSTQGDCVLIPTETAGPYPLDLTENNTFFRQDPREDRTGVQLNLKLRVIGLENCLPMANVRVNIWHCDKDGNYSGYGTEQGKTYLRAWQITDANGETEFVTVFPGWYNGRICHIHFQVYVSETYAAISQLTFDLEAKNALYAAHSTLYTKGADPLTFSSDNIFSDGYTYQLASLTENTVTGGYDSYLEVTVQGAGTTGISNRELETAKHLLLGQNFPNPFDGKTLIPVEMKNPGHARLRLWNLAGQLVRDLDLGLLAVGTHEVAVDFDEMGLAPATMAYQVEVSNAFGTYSAVKLMTAR